MSKWVGYAVSVNCGEPLGCYQGTIMKADGNTLTLTKPFRNGFPYPKSHVTLKASDIKDLKIIEEKSEPSEQTHSTVAVPKSNKKSQRATVCENLQANPTNTVEQGPASGGGGGGGAVGTHKGGGRGGGSGATPARSKPIDIQASRPNKSNANIGSYGNSGSTPKSRGGGGSGGTGGGGGGGHEKARRRNEACFGEAAEPALDDDFDFEGNLALFDKRALWERMRSAKPDLVRAALGADRYRHDENVLGAPPPPRAAAALAVPPELRGPRDYVTDAGVAVPSVAPRLRRQLWEGLERLGLGEFSRALLARAAADVALRLAGGGRRLEPRNAHQAPAVVALCGAHALGAAGLAAARLLASHGARAVALAPRGGAQCAEVRRELDAAAPGDVTLAHSAAALPAPDVLLLALHDPLHDDPPQLYAEELAWAGASRGAAVALEPPAAGWGGVTARASVVALAPPALPPSLGRVFLADVAAPARVFSERRVQYRAPFGASSLLPLHPADD